MDMSIVWVCPVDTPDKDIDIFKAGPVDMKQMSILSKIRE
jgi:hypothetical protein